MVDDIPVAHRQSSPYLTRSSPSWLREWRWLFLLGFVVIGLGMSLWMAWGALLSFSTQPGQIPQITQTTERIETFQTPIPGASPQAASESLGTPAARPSVLGHFSYEEAPAEELESVGNIQGRQILLRRAAAQSYREMAAAAQHQGIRLVPISGFRTQADQEYLFFRRAQDRAQRPAERAEVSAPPGYSEHHTGYAIDMGDAAAPQTLLQVSFEQTQAFQWLEVHAPRFGFELSFPKDNEQGVSYEPWHWRFVGDRHSLETFYGQAGVAP